MCGIVGIWDYKNKVSREILEKMRDELSYRGPDDAGIFISENANIGLAHRRLSIIDLSSSGHQPMPSENKNLWIVSNGEIYNFKEIRKDLEKKGYNFRSNSDTEVVLKSYQDKGKEAVREFRGMFSFAILDKEKEKLILCRDRAGVKPLYYYFERGLFIFASGIRAIISHPRVKKEINFDALALFLKFGYIPAPHSIFKNIYKLEPGYFLEIDKQGHIKKDKYWDVVDFYLKKSNYGKSEKNVEEELEKILIDSFKLRLVSDVPVGIFLSGGIDSTLVTALLAKNTNYSLKTFTIGFQEQEYNEAGYAKKIANYLGTEHHEMLCTQKEALDIIPKLPEIYDEPFGDSSAIPTYLLSQFTRKQVKVSLSADGGDEIFCGYNHYKLINDIFCRINKIPSIFLNPTVLSQGAKLFLKSLNLQNKIRKINKAIENKKDLRYVFTTINSYWLKDEIIDLLTNDFSFPETFFNDFKRIKDLDPITQMQAIDFKTYLPSDILTKVDRATMAVGLEGRDPFLDQNIIEYAAKLPLKFKYQKKQTKYILKKILAKHLPKELFKEPKKGFGVPIDLWFKDKLKPLLKEYLNPKKIEQEKIFNRKIIEKELNDYFSDRSNCVDRLWLILIFEMWKEKWL